MTKQLYKVGTVVATSAIIFASFGSAVLADTSVTISGNGAFSTNNVTMNQSTSTTVSQNNSATVNNNVTSNATTGGNSAFGNTGGNTAIHTGDATTNTTVNNSLNSNAASVNSCGCQGTTTLKIAGNGAVSDNAISDNSSNDTVVSQNNTADVHNNVKANASTGDNSADDNTGGNVVIGTGDASTSALVTTNANHNVASVGGTGGDGGLDVTVTGNGAFSSNDVNADLASETALDQENDADISNDVSQNAKTGSNSAFGNTGGNVGIGTGNAGTAADVMNDVNYNFANFGTCSCDGTVGVDVSGNGADGSSDGYNGIFGDAGNTVNLDLENDQVAGQGNDYNGENAANVNGNAKSGDNSVNFSTGNVTDPTVGTGSASNDTVVSNSGNVNALGSGDVMVTPPPMTGGTGFDWTWFWSMCNCL